MKKMADSGFLPVVIGDGSYNDLGVIRSLGEMGLHSVYLTGGEHIIPIRKSKYLLASIIANLDTDLVNTLRSIAQEYEKKLVLFPVSDRAALGIDNNGKILAAFSLFPHVQGRAAYFMDKGVQVSMACRAGFIVPDSIPYDLESETVPYDNIRLPCIVKPLLSIRGSKAHISVCRTKEELKTCINNYEKCQETS